MLNPSFTIVKLGSSRLGNLLLPFQWVGCTAKKSNNLGMGFLRLRRCARTCRKVPLHSTTSTIPPACGSFEWWVVIVFVFGKIWDAVVGPYYRGKPPVEACASGWCSKHFHAGMSQANLALQFVRLFERATHVSCARPISLPKRNMFVDSFLSTTMWCPLDS